MPKEAALYPIIGRLFADKGFFALENEFGVPSHVEGSACLLDIFACRWNGDECATASVEAKDETPPKGILSAIPQALDAMASVGSVYVATPAGNHAPVLNMLRALGIGYVSVEGGRAVEVCPPDASKLSLKDEARYSSNVRSRAKLLLAFRECSGTTGFRRGGLIRLEESWLAADLRANIQHNAWVEADTFRSGLNLERTRDAVRIFGPTASIDPRELQTVLRSLPDHYELRVHRRRKVPSEAVWNVVRCRTRDITLGDVKRVISVIRKIIRNSKGGWRPQLSISRPLWAVSEDPPRGDAEDSLRQVLHDIAPVVDCLSAGH